MAVEWICKKFYDLTPLELYSILQLRSEVFVVEQNCIFPDADNKDQDGYHLMGWKKDLLAAYSRLLPAGISYPSASIGRVVTSPSARREGLGKQLMQRSIAECYKLFGRAPITIGAQLYLGPFYTSFGFHAIGPVYAKRH